MIRISSILAAASSGDAALSPRSIWLTIIVLIAFIVALLSGILTWAAKRKPHSAVSSTSIDIQVLAAAVLYAGAAFGGTIGLFMAIYAFIAG